MTCFICRTSVLEPDLGSLCDQIEGSVKPVVAAVQGYALGGGLELACSAQYRVCHPKAKWVTILVINYSECGGSTVECRTRSIEKSRFESCFSGFSSLRKLCLLNDELCANWVSAYRQWWKNVIERIEFAALLMPGAIFSRIASLLFQ